MSIMELFTPVMWSSCTWCRYTIRLRTIVYIVELLSKPYIHKSPHYKSNGLHKSIDLSLLWLLFIMWSGKAIYMQHVAHTLARVYYEKDSLSYVHAVYLCKVTLVKNV